MSWRSGTLIRVWAKIWVLLGRRHRISTLQLTYQRLAIVLGAPYIPCQDQIHQQRVGAAVPTVPRCPRCLGNFPNSEVTVFLKKTLFPM